MFEYVPDVFRAAVRGQRGRGRRLVQGPGQQQAHPRPAAPRRGRPRHQLRGQGRPRVAARRRLPRHRLAAAQGRDPAPAAVDVPPVQGAGRRRHHRRADGGRARPATTSWAASRSTPTPRPPPTCPGLFASGEVAGGMHGSNRLGGNSLSDLLVFGRRSGEGAAAYVKALKGQYPKVTQAQVDELSSRGASRRSSGTGETAYELHEELQQCMNDLVGIIRKRTEIEDALERLEKLKERAVARVGGRRPGVQPGLAPRPRPAQHAGRVRVHRPGGADARGVARRPHPRRLPEDERDVAQGQPDLLAERQG